MATILHGRGAPARVPSARQGTDASILFGRNSNRSAEAGVSAALTGTATGSITETDVVDGGKTIILTLTGDTFVTGTSSEDGIAGGGDSDKTGANKWDALIKTDLDNTDVVLSTTTVTNDTATITLPAYASYDTDEQEEITWTIPAASLTTSVSDVVASPTFTVDLVSAGAAQAFHKRFGGTPGANLTGRNYW